MDNENQVLELLHIVQGQNKRIFYISMIVIILLLGYIAYDRYRDSISKDTNVEQTAYDLDNSNVTQSYE